MKILLLGCGMQGRGCAYDLVHSPGVHNVTLADVDEDRAKKLSIELGSSKARARKLDASQIRRTSSSLTGYDVVINAAPYEYILDVTHAAMDAGMSLVDLGGDTDKVLRQLDLNNKAREKGITIIPDCGVGPGITNIMVGHAMDRLDLADDVQVRDGGLPQNPKPPLFYSKLFSIDVLINEYTGKTFVVRDFETVEVEALSEIEELQLPDPVGKCEATFGMGMLSTLPWSYQKRIRNMDNKFLRYPGHFAFFQTLKQLGFLSEGAHRELSRQLLDRHFTQSDTRDLYVIQTKVRGTKANKRLELKYDLLDYYDSATEISAMSRTTGFTASIVAQMIGNKIISGPGVLAPELAVPKDLFFEELKKRGININWTCLTLPS